MRRGLVSTVAVAGLALTVGVGRADEPPVGARGSIVVPVGDKVHGYLRGGETHVFEAHLAKGDVYSFNLAAPRGSRLLMLVTVRDPSGREINAEAGAKHLAHGRRVTVGPYRVPKTGTYTIELAGDGPYEGEYAGASKVKAKRVSYALPTGLVPLSVPVAAGATLKIRAKGDVARIVAALPDQLASDLSGTDPFVVALRSRGLASSSSATYAFSAPDSKDAQVTLQVTRPNWKPNTVEFPTLPEDAELRKQRLEWFAGWQPAPQAAAGESARTPIQVANAVVGSDVSTRPGGSPATLFVNGRFEAATANISGGLSAIDSPPAGVVTNPIDGAPVVVVPTTPPTPKPVVETPPVNPPVPPVVAPPAVVTTPPVPPVTQPPVNSFDPTKSQWITNIYGNPVMPSFAASQAIGRSAFLLDSAAGQPRWRNAPWTTAPLGYPKVVYQDLLPITDTFVREQPTPEFGDASDPFVRRTFTNLQPKFGLYAVGSDRGDPAKVITTVRYFVDGHQVSDLLLTGGDTRIEWTVEGNGHTDSNKAWTIDGKWTMDMHTSADAPATAILAGREHFNAGGLDETVYTDSLSLRETKLSGSSQYDVVGTMLNELKAPAANLSQVVERVLQPLQVGDDGKAVKATVVRITTNDFVRELTGSFLGSFWSRSTK